MKAVTVGGREVSILCKSASLIFIVLFISSFFSISVVASSEDENIQDENSQPTRDYTSEPLFSFVLSEDENTQDEDSQLQSAQSVPSPDIGDVPSDGISDYELFQYYEVYTTHENGLAHKTMNIYPQDISVWDESSGRWVPYISTVGENEIEVISPIGTTSYSSFGIIRDNHFVLWDVFEDNNQLNLAYSSVSSSIENGVFEVRIEYDTSIGKVWFVEQYEFSKPVRSLLRVLFKKDTEVTVQFVLENNSSEIEVFWNSAFVDGLVYNWEDNVLISQRGSLELSWENVATEVGSIKEFDPTVTASEMNTFVVGKQKKLDNTWASYANVWGNGEIWTSAYSNIPFPFSLFYKEWYTRTVLYYKIPDSLRNQSVEIIDAAPLISPEIYPSMVYTVEVRKCTQYPSGYSWQSSGNHQDKSASDLSLWNTYSSYFTDDVLGHIYSGPVNFVMDDYVQDHYQEGYVKLAFVLSDESLVADKIIKYVAGPMTITYTYRPNTPSTPSGPSSGKPGKSYTFSTSATDPDGDQVKYYWDWNGDGTADEWSSLGSSGWTDSRSHSWSTSGTYNVKVKAQDSWGAESGWSFARTVTIGNNPPNAPSNPNPTSGATGVWVSSTLSWTGGDPDGDATTYDVYFGTSSSPTKVATGLTSTSYSPGTLNYGTTYYWKIVASDGLATTSGQVWSFTTSVEPIQPPSVVTQSATNVTPASAILNGHLTSLGGASSCQVWFEWGTTTSYGSSTSSLNRTSISYFNASISGLTSGVTYHFRAVAQNSAGTSYGSDFTVVPPFVTLPSVATNSATSVTTTSATLNGNLTGLGGASSCQVWFEWGTTTSYGSSTLHQYKWDTGSFNASISGLTTEVTYHFRAAAQNSAGTSYGSDFTVVPSKTHTSFNVTLDSQHLANFQFVALNFRLVNEETGNGIPNAVVKLQRNGTNVSFLSSLVYDPATITTAIMSGNQVGLYSTTTDSGGYGNAITLVNSNNPGNFPAINSPGVFRLKFEGDATYDGTESGGYQVSIGGVSIDAAAKIACANNLDYFGEEDTSRYYETSTQEIVAATVTPNSDYDLYLYDSNQNLVASSTLRGDVPDTIVYKGATPDNYYIEVRRISGWGMFLLSVDNTLPTPPAVYEDHGQNWTNQNSPNWYWSADDAETGIKQYEVYCSWNDDTFCTNENNYHSTLVDGIHYIEVRAQNCAGMWSEWSEPAHVYIDNTPPISAVDTISPYWQGEPPFTVTAQASDDLSGVESVELYYRYSNDNSAWDNWTLFGTDSDNYDGWSWSFTAPEGDGYYEFRSFATDAAGNVEGAPPAPEGWLSGWEYRRPATMNNTGNATTLTDYQIKIDVTYDENMKSDFSDLRFTDKDGTTLLNYWVENYTASTSAVVWVKVPSIPALNTKTIYVYYGNPTATSEEDGDNVFEFFDDFSNSNWAGKWTLENGTAPTVADGMISLAGSTSQSTAPWLSSKFTVPSDTVTYTRFYAKPNAWATQQIFVTDTMMWYPAGSCYYTTDYSTNVVGYGMTYWVTTSFYTISASAPGQYVENGRGTYTEGWKDVELAWTGDNVSFESPEGSWAHTQCVPAQGSPLNIQLTGGRTVAERYDTVYVRTFASSETQADIGDEEQMSVIVADTCVGVDTVAPLSSVDSIEPYWRNDEMVPFEITATAEDPVPANGAVPSGLKSVELFYRYSPDNVDFGPWTSYCVDDDGSDGWSWMFDVRGGGENEGHYEFRSVANEVAGNVEEPSAEADTTCGFDTTLPTSSVDLIETYWKNSTMVPFAVTATASNSLSGVSSVELYYRYSVDNSTWGSWTSFGVDGEAPWSWTFSAPEGDGYYEFYSVATDEAGNDEAVPAIEEILFADNFNDGDAAEWTAYHGDWQVVSGEYVYGAAGITDTDGITAAGNGSWENYVFETRFKLIQGEPQVYFLLRLANYVNQADYDGYNFQYWPYASRWILSKTGADPLAQEPNTSTITLGEWYTVRVELTGDRIKCYINNELKIDAHDSSFLTGRVGLRADMNKVSYDDVKVYMLAPLVADARCGVDTIPPGSSVNMIEPYWQSTIPLEVSATASDELSGVANVELWYRYSNDNSTWGSWTFFGTDDTSPYSWSFNAPDGDGYYEFCSVAVDWAGNIENELDRQQPPFEDNFDTLDQNVWWTNFSHSGGSYWNPSYGSAYISDSVLCMRPGYYRGGTLLETRGPVISTLPATVRFRIRFEGGGDYYRAAMFALGSVFEENVLTGTYPYVMWPLSTTHHLYTERQRVILWYGPENYVQSSEFWEIIPADTWLEGEMRLYSDRVETSFNGANLVVYGDVGSIMNFSGGLNVNFSTWDDYAQKGFDLDWVGVYQEMADRVADARCGVDTAPPEITISSPQEGRQYIAKRENIPIDFAVNDAMDPSPTISAYLTDVEDGTVVMVENGQSIDPLSIDDGFWKMTVEARDWANNTASVTTGQFEVIHDIQPPRTSMAVGTPQYSGDCLYVTSATGFTLSVVDDLVEVGDGEGLGVALTEYRIDDGHWTTYGAPFTVSAEGPHTIYYHSVDVVGNVEEIQSLEVVVDDTPPASSVLPISPYWHNVVPLEVEATASDELSGVDKVELFYRYSADNITFGSWTLFATDTETPWSWRFDAPEGDGYYEFASIANDGVGNLELFEYVFVDVFVDEFSGTSLDTTVWSTGKVGVTYDNIAVSGDKLMLTARAAKSGTYGVLYAVSNSPFDFSQDTMFEVQMSVPTDNAPGDFRSEFYLCPTYTTTENPHDAPDWLRVSASVDRSGVRWMLQRRIGGGEIGTLYTSGPTSRLDGTWRVDMGSENVAVWLNDELVEPTRTHGLNFASAYMYLCERTKVAPVYTVTFDYVNVRVREILADARAGVDTATPISSVDPISPYWQNNPPIDVTATAQDPVPPNGAVPSGVSQVELWYRSSTDNLVWTEWKKFETDAEPPLAWQFAGPDSYYEFYSIAVDVAQNVEESPDNADAEVCIDTTPPAIENLLAEPSVFAPRSGCGGCWPEFDHRRDNETTISYTLVDALSPTCQISVKIYDLEGNLVRILFSGTEIAGVQYAHVWDGRDDGGEIVPDGPYTFVVGAVDLAGNENQADTSVVVDAERFDISHTKSAPKRFNPELGEITEINYELSEPAETLSITIYCRNTPVRHLVVDELMPVGGNSVLWDGRDDNGAILPSGVYKVKISATSFAGENAQEQATVRIDDRMPVIANVADSPDPFSPDNDGVEDTTTISYTLLSSAGGRRDNTLDVTIVIYGASSDRHRTLCDGLDGLFGDDVDEDDFDDRGGHFGKFWDGAGQGDGVMRTVRIQVARLEQEPGEQSWTWDGTDSRGRVVANGTYKYTIIARNGWHFSNLKEGTVTVERRDTLAPVASDESPRDGSTVQDRSPLISVDLSDELSGADPATINLKVDNVQMAPTIVETHDGYRVKYQPENAFERGATVVVEVRANDLEGNSMVYSWSFTIKRGRN
jgi:flagellar hook assembly protein FlgD